MNHQSSDEMNVQDEASQALPISGVLGEGTGQRAEELRQVLAAIVESSDDAIIAKTLDGVITSWNRGAERIFGYAADEVIGRHISVLKPPEHSEDVIQILERIRHGEQVNHFETKRCTKDGRIIDVSLSISPIRDADGKIVGASKVVRDITERKQGEEKFRLAVEAAPNAMVMVNREGNIVLVNAETERLFGYGRDELLGQPVELLVPERVRGKHPAYRAGFFAHSETRAMGMGRDLSGRRKDGSEFSVEIGLNPISTEEGPFVLAGIVDITERKQGEEERKRLLATAEAARAEAEAANRMKDEFLATLSHELRTPLNAIVGWARILRSGKVDAEDLEEGLAAIERNAQVQAQLVEDLLDISRISSGNLRLDVQRVKITEVIEAALAAVMPAANAKGIRIHKVLDSLAGPVTGDFARLQQVVWNLLSNAVKFTPKGGRVQVLLERVNSHVEISVIDTGMGIRPEFLPHVFDRFRQADATTTRQHGGLGLGLAIAKQLVEMHGGSIRAKSPGEGQGATFTVTLPIIVVHPERPEAEMARPKEAITTEEICLEDALAGLKVLVVDDEPDARELIRRVLEDCKAEVALATSAAAALELLGPFRPDVIVSDIGMPEQDGYDLIRQVRANYSAKQLPAAALTAFARTEERKRALLAGFQTHIAKPVDPAELTAAVASLAGRTGQSGQHYGEQT